jgi:pilus assembly protein CpaE
VSTAPRIVLLTLDPEFEDRLRESFDARLNGSLLRWPHGPGQRHPIMTTRDLLGEQAVDVVALGPGVLLDEALDLALRVEYERPDVSVVLVTPPTPQVWERALRAGVRDVIAPDATPADLRETLERAALVAERRRASLPIGQPEPALSGRVITVLSPKGGSGKTTMAANLAVGLAASAPGEVVVVDLDVQFGDISTALQLDAETSIADAVRGGDVLDPMALKVHLAPHPSGLFALCGPESPAAGEEITATHVLEVLKVLAGEFRYVVVDTSAGLNEHALAALELSTDIVAICSMDVPSVRSLRKELAALDQLGMTHATRHFVLNRSDARVGLDIGDVEATLGMRVDVAISSSRAVPLSMNQGTPILMTEPRSAIGRQLGQMVQLFTDKPEASPTGLLRRRKGAR